MTGGRPRTVSANELKEVFAADELATYVHIRDGDKRTKEPTTHYARLNEDGTLPKRTLCARLIRAADRVMSDRDTVICGVCNKQRLGGKWK